MLTDPAVTPQRCRRRKFGGGDEDYSLGRRIGDEYEDDYGGFSSVTGTGSGAMEPRGDEGADQDPSRAGERLNCG